MTTKWLNPDINVEQDVTAFFDKFGVPRKNRPSWPDHAAVNFRMKHLEEEWCELKDAVEVRDMAGTADALIDIVYLAVGTCLTLGIPFSAVWREVQEANMAKVRAKADGSDSKRGSGYDVVKPKGWTPPNVEGVLKMAKEMAQ